MSDLDEQESEFSRLVSRASFDDAPRGEHRDVLRRDALSQFESAGSSPRPGHWKSTLQQGRKLMRHPLVRFSALAAAGLVVAVVWLLVPGQQPTAEAFHKFAAAIVEAKTAKFATEVAIEGQPHQRFQAYYRAPGRFRQELPGNMVNIADWNAGTLVGLNTSRKTAMVMKLKGAPKQKGSMDLFERMRELLANSLDSKEGQFERLGEKEIEGHRAVGFRLDSPLATLTLWGDLATGEPVLIQTVYSGVPRTEATMKDFELNVELKESLFDLTPPAGYKVQSIDVDASPPTEANLVDALRITSDMADGTFPETLDTAGIMKAMIGYMMKQKKDNKQVLDEQTQQMMQTSMNIGRGINFALMLPPTADAHYAGKGVKRDAQDTPIFWYKPEAKGKYRVIYADLSSREADDAPQVPAAVRIEKTGKLTPPAEK